MAATGAAGPLRGELVARSPGRVQGRGRDLLVRRPRHRREVRLVPLLGPSVGGMTAIRDLGPGRGPVRRLGQGVLQDSQPREGELIDAEINKATTKITMIYIYIYIYINMF